MWIYFFIYLSMWIKVETFKKIIFSEISQKRDVQFFIRFSKRKNAASVLIQTKFLIKIIKKFPMVRTLLAYLKLHFLFLLPILLGNMSKIE